MRRKTLKKKPVTKTLPEARKRFIFIALGGLVLILVIWGIVLIATFTKPSSSAVETPQEQVQVLRGVSGKTVEEDQRDALAATVALLNAAGESPTQATALERLKKVEAGDYSVVSKGLEEGLHLPPGTPEGLKQSAYESLITLNMALQSQTGKTVIAPAGDNAHEAVLMDSGLGMGFVPLGALSGKSAVFDFEMVYVEGQWKLAPYSLVSQVRLSALLTQQQQQATPQPTPSR